MSLLQWILRRFASFWQNFKLQIIILDSLAKFLSSFLSIWIRPSYKHIGKFFSNFEKFFFQKSEFFDLFSWKMEGRGGWGGNFEFFLKSDLEAMDVWGMYQEGICQDFGEFGVFKTWFEHGRPFYMFGEDFCSLNMHQKGIEGESLRLGNICMIFPFFESFQGQCDSSLMLHPLMCLSFNFEKWSKWPHSH